MSSTRERPIKKKKYCRKKKVLRHANPLFEKWLFEWQKDAEGCGSNMKYNYMRARKSLKLYPIPVYHGKDCKVLAHFGDKICAKLDHRLQEYIDENGPINWEEIHQILETPAKKKRVRKKAENKKAPARENGHESPTVSSPPDLEVTVNGGHKGRAYIPSFRSGAYALLVTLYNTSRESNSLGFMKKAELMEAAQPLCNASFTHTADGSHYTAWSSMSTLIKKELVSREGNPSRYSLTAEGKVLAAKLLSAVNSDTSSSSHMHSQRVDNIEDVVTLSSRSCSPCSLSSSPVKENRLLESISVFNPKQTVSEPVFSQMSKWKTDKMNVDEENKKIGKRKNSPTNSVTKNEMSESLASFESSPKGSGGLIFSYITSLDMETPLKDRAVVSVEDDGFLGFLVKCRLSSLLSSNLSYRLDDNRTAPLGFAYAYLSNECAPDMSPGLLSPCQKLPTATTRSVPTAKTPFGTCFSASEDSNLTTSKVSSKKMDSGSTSSSSSSVKVPTRVPSLQRSSETVSSVKRICQEIPSSQPQFSLHAGRYEIILCIDNCETKGGFTGGSKHSTKDIILNELNKHKIHYDVRKLHVGDFLWIFRERASPLSNMDQPKELVLPYIVERKRMDDLASSIRDGRFKEQKFRLKQCGLSKPIYLVEEYGTQNLSLPESTCMQAITNTQVVDGFTVKITKDQQESAAFLTIMTRCLQSRYQGKTVRSLMVEDLQAQTQAISDNGIETALMTFADFNTSSMKNHQLPVREMFAKHLLQLHGLSVEKAKAVVDKYGTPASLMSEYEALKNPMDSEQMLASLRCGKTGRNLGPALSVNIAKLYTNLMLK